MARWGQANIEVIASRDYITDELKQSVPMQRIYDALFERQRITVSYNSFRLQIRTMKAQQAATANENACDGNSAPKTLSSPETSSLGEKTSNHTSDKFVFNPIGDLRNYNQGK